MRSQPRLSRVQQDVMALLRANRSPESFAAGANIGSRSSARLSNDIDLFHDSRHEVWKAFEIDAKCLRDAGWKVNVIVGPLDGFVRADLTSPEGEKTLVDWAYDSSWRFFPVEEDQLFGWRLHWADAATSKLLAAAGRGEPKDLIDLLAWHREPLSVGALAWAACAKDPGFSPQGLLDALARIRAPSPSELSALDLPNPPSPGDIKARMHEALEEGARLIERLPEKAVGCLFLNGDGEPIEPDPDDPETLARPRPASRKGCLPRFPEPELSFGP